MSADNGIYILKTVCTNGATPHYRVAETSAIDNFKWYEENEPYNLGAYMQDVWGKSPFFKTYNEAFIYAQTLEEKQYTEYGICNIETTYRFYNDPYDILMDSY